MKISASRAGWQRILVALSSTGMASIGNLMLTVAVARSTDVEGVGRFALALSLGLLVTGALRSSHSEVLATVNASQCEIQLAAVAVGRASLLFVPPLLAVAAVFESTEVGMIALFCPLISVFEHYRYCSVALRGSWWAGVMELPKVVVSLAALLFSSQQACSPTFALAAWLGAASAMAIITYAVGWRSTNRTSEKHAIDARTSLAFGLQFVIGDGATQATTVMLALVAGLAVNGALKGGGTVLGPFALVVTAVNSLLIPYFARSVDRIRTSAAALSTVGSAVIGLLLVTFVLFLPPSIGVLLLGETWEAALPVLPMLALDLVATTFGFPPQSALKALLASRPLVGGRIVTSSLRVSLVTFAALNSDAVGVATAMALSAVFSATAWWVVLLHVAPRGQREKPPQEMVN